jgi:hypothetical protein
MEVAFGLLKVVESHVNAPPKRIDDRHRYVGQPVVFSVPAAMTKVASNANIWVHVGCGLVLREAQATAVEGPVVYGDVGPVIWGPVGLGNQTVAEHLYS